MDITLIKELGIFAAGLIIAPIGYILKRRIERRSEHEDLELKERLLRINRELKDQNIVYSDLRTFRENLKRRAENKDTHSKFLEVVDESASISDCFVTQVQMNATSFEEFEVAELAMQQAFRRLQSILEGDSLDELKKSQVAWKNYRDKQVIFAGGLYRGGSIVPLIHNSEAAALTNARYNDLNSTYEDLQLR